MKKKLGLFLIMSFGVSLLSFCGCTKEEDHAPIEGTVTENEWPVVLELPTFTATTSVFKGSVDLDQVSKYDEVGVICSLSEDMDIDPLVADVVPVTNIDKYNCFVIKIRELLYDTKYYYSTYIRINGIYKFGEIKSFTTEDVVIEVNAPTVTSTTAVFQGKVTANEVDIECLRFGIAWSAESNFENDVNEQDVRLNDDGTFAVTIENLMMDNEYYYAPYINQQKSNYGIISSFSTTTVVHNITPSEITQASVTLVGKVEGYDVDKGIEHGILYSTAPELEVGASGSVKIAMTDIFDDNGEYSLRIDDLMNSTKYYYCWYACQEGIYKYGVTQEFTTNSVRLDLSVDAITQTTATFRGSYDELEDDDFEIGILYSLSSSDLSVESKESTKLVLTDKNFSQKVTGLKYNTTYYYCTYVCQKGEYKYNTVQTFQTSDVKVDVSVSEIAQTSAVFSGTVEITESDVIEVGILYSTESSLSLTSSSTFKEVISNADFSFEVSNLQKATKYYYKYYIKQDDEYAYGESRQFATSGLNIATSSGSYNYIGGDFEFSYNIFNPSEGEHLHGEPDVEWITDVAVSDNKVTYKVLLNTDGSFRTGNIILTYLGEEMTFRVSQSAAKIILTTFSARHVSDCSSGSFDYSIPDRVASEELELSSNVDWITGLTDNGSSISYLVSENNSGFCRSGRITMTYAGVSKVFNVNQIKKPVDLSSAGSANCYIVSQSDAYSFEAVKGNSNTSVGSVSSVSVLWESLGTSTSLSVGSLVENVLYRDGRISFEATSMKGNAVIAAKDASGKILWSWHIWLTDQPEAQVYNNNAGTMMDRNLGATSATPGDVGALGLLYQWGRKDPFLGSSSVSSSVVAASTITWPSAVKSESSTGTIDYVTANPTTFVTYNSNNYDWYYTGSSSTDNTRWQSEKTIYDPCPAGWRVPDGGVNGVWKTAGFVNTTYDSANKGVSFAISSSSTWYPASGYRGYDDGGLTNVGNGGYYWSVTPGGYNACYLYFYSDGIVNPSFNKMRAGGYPVRCLQLTD